MAFIALGIVALGWVSARLVVNWRYRAELDQAQRALARGDYEEARGRFLSLTARWPARGEGHDGLGRCEQAAGRIDAALAAWRRVPPGSDGSGRIALQRGALALEHGRFAVAEESLEQALARPGDHRAEAYWQLGRLLRYQGRLDDVRRLLHRRLADGLDPLMTLRDLWELDALPIPVVGLRGVLEAAAREAPEDDRVWLGQAYLAIRTGDHGGAERWLDRCAARRPGDPVVAGARLAWALAARDVGAARRALARLPSDGSTPAELAALSAWFAARRGDAAGERAALERVVDADPADPAALERLIALVASDPDRVAALRARKTELDRAKGRRDQIMVRDDRSPMAHAGELARLAATLGRLSEARAWADLRLRRVPGDAATRALRARLASADWPRLPSGRTLADLLPDLPAAAVGADRPVPATGQLPAFTDDAEAAGLQFVFDNGRSPRRQLPETMSGGLAVLDYDGDGWLDVYAVQGGPFPPPSGAARAGDRLFRNRGDGSFEDASERAGLAGLPGGYGHGVAVGDYDGDGDPDLFVTRWRSYALYCNDGDGTFSDATAAAGLDGDRDWPTSAAFADLDGDGDLDLYVCHYLIWDAEHPRLCRREGGREYEYCNPRHFHARPDHLFRNDGGRFVDVTAAAGIVDADGRGLGVVATDLDGDGLVDLYVANDMSANFLFHNRGGLRFEEVGHLQGVAAGGDGGYRAGMGIARGDLDGDGRLDLAVTNFYGEGTTFYRDLGGGQFCDASHSLGLGMLTRYRLGFGVALCDVDNDGRLDVATANGHVTDFEPVIPYAMPAQLLVGGADGRLTDVTDRAGAPWPVPRLGRGLASGDLDNDGRVDLVVLAQGTPLAYFHNRTPGGHWVTFRLEGTSSNRDAVGARVTVAAAGSRRVAERSGGGSYQSACDPRLHFGLGPARQVDSVEVRWPSGRVDRFRDLAADSGYLLREGSTEPLPLRGFPPGPRGGADRSPGSGRARPARDAGPSP